jgi:hypothetical protein
MSTSQARNRLFALVRTFSQATPDWAPAIRYEIKRDEVNDIFLASERVYGTPDDWAVIQAAAGLDSPEYPLGERTIVLPTKAKLRDMKKQAGYEDAEIF